MLEMWLAMSMIDSHYDCSCTSLHVLDFTFAVSQKI